MNLRQSRQSPNVNLRLTRQTWRACLRQTLMVAPILVLVSSSVVGLRAFLAGEPTQQAVHTMLNTLKMTSVASVILGGLYTFFGALFGDEPTASSRSRPTCWPVVLVSAYIGTLGGAPLYLVSGSQFIAQVDPLREVSSSALLIGQFGLLGGLDGCIVGGGVGLFIDSLDSRAMHFTRDGVTRYVLLYTISAALLALYVLLDKYLKVNTACLNLGCYLFLTVVSLFRRGKQ